MKEPVVVPSMGESVSKGTIVAWLVRSGAGVKEGDELFELETDKATVRVPAGVAGELSILVEAGGEVAVGQQVAVIDTAARSSAAAVDAGAVAVPAMPPPSAAEPRREPPPAPPPASFAAAAQDGGTTPAQTRVPMTALRRRTAQRLVEARREAVHVTTFNEIDMGKVMEIRARCQEAFEKKHGIKLGLMSFFVKACCKALDAYPVINASIEGDDIVYHNARHIGVAVALEHGLVVPVIRHAGRRTFADIERAIAVMAQRARDKLLTPDELAGGTFSITNGGVFGSLLSTPVPAFPQSAILGMHAIKKRPVVVADAVAIRPMMYAALTYDHRIIDGREAIGFLVRVKELIEDPDRLLLET